MAYHALPDKPGTPVPLDNAEDQVQLPGLIPLQRKRLKAFWRLSTANLALLVLQLVLLLAHSVYERHATGRTQVQGTYGFDTKYMTLAHDYDWLWKEPAIQRAGAIALTRNEENEVVEYGVISMYVIGIVRYMLPIGISSNTAFRFHQLHCVASLRTALQTAYEGGNVAFDQDEDPHWPHCLHYLHQVHYPPFYVAGQPRSDANSVLR